MKREIECSDPNCTISDLLEESVALLREFQNEPHEQFQNGKHDADCLPCKINKFLKDINDGGKKECS